MIKHVLYYSTCFVKHGKTESIKSTMVSTVFITSYFSFTDFWKINFSFSIWNRVIMNRNIIDDSRKNPSWIKVWLVSILYIQHYKSTELCSYLTVMAWIPSQKQNPHHWPCPPHVDKWHAEEEQHLEGPESTQTLQDLIRIHLKQQN